MLTRKNKIKLARILTETEYGRWMRVGNYDSESSTYKKFRSVFASPVGPLTFTIALRWSGHPSGMSSKPSPISSKRTYLTITADKDSTIKDLLKEAELTIIDDISTGVLSQNDYMRIKIEAQQLKNKRDKEIEVLMTKGFTRKNATKEVDTNIDFIKKHSKLHNRLNLHDGIVLNKLDKETK